MQKVLKTIFLCTLLALPVFGASALPEASHPEGTFNFPSDCQVTGHRYVESDKCAGGQCYVPSINCCGNSRTDEAYFDSVTGEAVSQAESCDGEDFCRENCTFCGDYKVDAEEDCDRGPTNGQQDSGCASDCRTPSCTHEPVSGGFYCGNNKKDCDEACDFVGVVAGKVCAANCGQECTFGLDASRFVITDDGRTAISDAGAVQVREGEEVFFEVEVRSPGCISYKNIEVTSTDGLSYSYVSGDSNGNNMLDVGETWLFRSGTKTFPEGNHVITSTVSGNGDIEGSPAVSNTSTYTVTAAPFCSFYDIDEHCGNGVKECDEECDYTGVQNGKVCSGTCRECDLGFGKELQLLVKTGNTETMYPVAEGASISVPLNSKVTFKLEVSNPGCVTYSNVTVTDSYGLNYTYLAGDDNSDSILDLDETWFYVAEDKEFGLGSYSITTTITGTANTVGSPSVNDTHSFSLIVANPNICAGDAASVRALCGNGVVQCAEQCDLGARNGVVNSGCSASCRITPVCGNGRVEAGEQCDKGARNNDKTASFDYNGKKYYCNRACDRVLSDCLWVANYEVEITGHTAPIAGVLNSANLNQSVPGCFKNKWPIRGCLHHNWGAVHSMKCESNSATTLAGFLGVPRNKRNTDGRYFMDKNCNYVESRADYNICGYAAVSSTPISLIWDTEVPYNIGNTIVQFDLDPQQSGTYTVWKASGSAPLLVYNPERSNEVTVKQLFGSWTFGGKQNAPLNNVGLKGAETPEPWSDGYEALSVLDANEDGEISGTELADLDLWFDYNRNARVDDGELKRLAELGVTALYFKNPTLRTVNTEELELVVGFKRQLHGEEIIGKSIDWYSKTFPGMKEALDSVGAELTAGGAALSMFRKVSTKEETELDFTPVRIGPDVSDISGYWIWTLENSAGMTAPGLFALQQEKNGKVRGYTVSEAKLADGNHNLGAVARILPLSGQVEKDSKTGELVFNFVVKDTDNRGYAKSSVRLRDKGGILEGSTDQQFISRDSGDEETVSLNYNWVATRVVAVD